MTDNVKDCSKCIISCCTGLTRSDIEAQACKKHHQSQRPDHGRSAIIVHLAEEECILKQHEDGFSERSEWQSHDEAICGMDGEANLLQLKGRRAQTLSAFGFVQRKDLWHFHIACSSDDEIPEQLESHSQVKACFLK